MRLLLFLRDSIAKAPTIIRAMASSGCTVASCPEAALSEKTPKKSSDRTAKMLIGISSHLLRLPNQ